MKRIHIFRAGTHTAMSGVTLDFSADQLREAAEIYSADVHEAPIVVGHPKDNGPAFGWIKGLEFEEDGNGGGDLYAIPHQVNEDFEEAVGNGSYKKVSASLYTPKSPSNPAPGKLYVRHVGFLGAQPPAIKGLEAIQFSDAGEDIETVEFSQEWEVAGVFRRLREFLIEKFGVEDADKAIPGYLVESAEDEARRPKVSESEDAQPDNSFAYYSENPDEESTMTEEELKAAQAKLEADQAKLEADQASFAEELTAAATAKAEARKAGIAAKVDTLVEAGHIPAEKADAVKDFAEKLDVDQVVEFGEGDDASQESATDFLFGLLEKPQVPAADFSERSGGLGEEEAPENVKDLSARALQYREEKKAEGIEISVTEAVNHIQSLAE